MSNEDSGMDMFLSLSLMVDTLKLICKVVWSGDWLNIVEFHGHIVNAHYMIFLNIRRAIFITNYQDKPLLNIVY